MGFIFTFEDIEKISNALGQVRVSNKSKVWRGMGHDGRFRQTYIHSHGSGRAIATGTAKAMARQLLFDTVEEMYLFLHRL